MYYVYIPKERRLIKEQYKVAAITRLLVLDYLPVELGTYGAIYRHILTQELAYLIKE